MGSEDSLNASRDSSAHRSKDEEAKGLEGLDAGALFWARAKVNHHKRWTQHRVDNIQYFCAPMQFATYRFGKMIGEKNLPKWRSLL